MSLEAEYAAAHRGAAQVDIPERGVLAATGPQRHKFLQGLLSNDVAALQAGQGCAAALLDVKGHVQALLRVLATPEALLLEMPADRLEPVERTFQHYRVAAPVRFQVVPAAVLAVLGPEAAAVLRAAGVEPPPASPAEGHASGSVGGHAVRVARAADVPLGGYALHVSPEGADAVRGALAAAGAGFLGRDALDVLRIEAGRPWYGPDVGEDNLLHETGLLAEYHSDAKGCYLGQEVVARLSGRGGNVNKRLRGLQLTAPAAPGAEVVAEGAPVGRVTTAGTSPRLGPLALGYVHRSHAAPGTAVEVAGAPAAVVALPFPPPAA